MLELSIGDRTYTARKGQTLLAFMQENGIGGVYAACNGQGTCGKCLVDVTTEQRMRVKACEYVLQENCTIDFIGKDEAAFQKGKDDRGHLRKTNQQPITVLAIDVGTTNICIRQVLSDNSVGEEEIIANPQSVYGADVMQRIQAANEGHLEQLSYLVLHELKKYVVNRKFASHATFIISANTTMRYFMEERDPQSLGVTPYKTEAISWGNWHVTSFGGKNKLDVSATILPGISAFVGGDIVSGIYALEMMESHKTSLLLDLGTNGEMALCHKGKLWVSSAPAGPAFETPKREYGSRLIACCAALLRQNRIDENGTLLEEPQENKLEFDGGDYTCNSRELQQDIRTLQLGKSAIRAGAETLLENAAVSWETVEEIYLAGNFGKRVSQEDVIEIGLLPRETKGRIQQVGNTSLEGALKYGLASTVNQPESDRCEKEKIDKIIAGATLVTLADSTVFGDKFLEYMFFESSGE